MKVAILSDDSLRATSSVREIFTQPTSLRGAKWLAQHSDDPLQYPALSNIAEMENVLLSSKYLDYSMAGNQRTITSVLGQPLLKYSDGLHSVLRPTSQAEQALFRRASSLPAVQEDIRGSKIWLFDHYFGKLYFLRFQHSLSGMLYGLSGISQDPLSMLVTSALFSFRNPINFAGNMFLQSADFAVAHGWADSNLQEVLGNLTDPFGLALRGFSHTFNIPLIPQLNSDILQQSASALSSRNYLQEASALFAPPRSWQQEWQLTSSYSSYQEPFYRLQAFLRQINFRP
jgi:hypothetical protein